MNSAATPAGMAKAIQGRLFFFTAAPPDDGWFESGALGSRERAAEVPPGGC